MIVGRNKECPCGSGKKFKKCHIGKIVPHISESFVISARKENKIYKIFRINFYKNKKGQESIIISLPYFNKTNGLLSRVTFPSNTRKIDKISLKVGGRTTSHSIKYSHWSDGNTHFSQDKKIYTTIKNASNPLISSVGHLFTLQVQGLNGFKLKEDIKVKSKRKVDLDVNLLDDINSIKFTGWWYDSTVVHDSGNHYGNPYFFKKEDGTIEKAFAVQPPKEMKSSSKILFISFSPKQRLTKEKGTHLLFLGGFDPINIFKDITKDFHFLAAIYPARNYKKLAKEIGTIDFNQELT